MVVVRGGGGGGGGRGGAERKVHQWLHVQRFAGWLSQILRREFTHARNFNSKFPPKVCACADFRRKFVQTNQQTSIQ